MNVLWHKHKLKNRKKQKKTKELVPLKHIVKLRKISQAGILPDI